VIGRDLFGHGEAEKGVSESEIRWVVVGYQVFVSIPIV